MRLFYTSSAAQQPMQSRSLHLQTLLQGGNVCPLVPCLFLFLSPLPSPLLLAHNTCSTSGFSPHSHPIPWVFPYHEMTLWGCQGLTCSFPACLCSLGSVSLEYQGREQRGLFYRELRRATQQRRDYFIMSQEGPSSVSTLFSVALKQLGCVC